MVTQPAQTIQISRLSTQSWQGPVSFSMGADEQLLVIDELGHRVTLLNRNGEAQWSVGNKGNGRFDLSYPTDSCFGDGFFWITDRYNHRVVCCDTEGNFRFSFGRFGRESPLLNEPFGICCDGQGKLFVTDSGNRKIKAFSMEGEFLFEIGMPGPGAEYFESPFFKNQTVFKKWARAQTRFQTLESFFFSSGFHSGDLEQPRGISVMEQRLYVADYSGRLQCFDYEGNLHRSWYPIRYCQWTATCRGTIFFSREFSSRLWRVDKNGEPEPVWQSEHEIGKFAILPDGVLVVCAPWTKAFFRIEGLKL